ncbi:MAG: tetratricopeptide repeat protein [bacterium]|nr:tetratricopeptide repeat protein [bacterium]
MPGTKRPLGRRRRRLYWTVGILLAAAVVGGGIGLGVFFAGRTSTYQTGEQHAEITRRLAQNVPDDAPNPTWTDVTQEAGLDAFRAFAGERSSQLPEDMGPGAAWGDYDDDGDDDLLLVSAGGPLTAGVEELSPSELYENRGDGTFRRVGGFPETRIVGMGAAWGDYDRDGRLDLVVTGFNALRLYRNRGGRFELDDSIPSRDGFWAGASWSDFDLDGDLDLYVCGYVQYVRDDAGRLRATKQYGRSVPYTLNPASYRPANNLLFINDGNGGFEEAAEALGVSNPEGRSLSALWHDLDDDGRPDLYVANDISDNVLYLNREGGFEDVSHAAWVADYRGAMGLAAGDWNRDGDDDLFVSHWVAQENALYDSQLANGADGRARPGAPLRFVDVADQRGLGQIALRRIGWGAEFGDLDGDGWLDLVVANGSTMEEDGEPRRLSPEPSFLFWNRRGESFHDLAPLTDALSTPRVSRGMALSDYDMDGDLDLLFVDSGEGVRLLRNEMQQGNWVQLVLRARHGETFVDADGAQVAARVGDATLRRTVSSASYLSQSSRRVHLGLGDAEVVDSLEVRWPSGQVQEFAELSAGAIWELKEDVAEARRVVVATALTREQLLEFWRLQRAAMDAVKIEQNTSSAIELFRRALALNPAHEDSLYYLGNCLAEQGDVDGALEQFEQLKRLNPSSHRAFKRWGTLRAVSASAAAEVDAAWVALERAVQINPEETGAPMVLAELALVRGDSSDARRRLVRIRQTNPGAGDAAFLLAYVAWRTGDSAEATRLLESAAANHEEWLPEGTVAEGDVQQVMHTDATLLNRLYETWNNSTDPDATFRALDAFVDDYRKSSEGQ